LRERNTVVRVADGLAQSANLRREALADYETCGVVLRAVDAEAGREALQGGGQIALRPSKVALRIQRQHVGVDDLTHVSKSPYCLAQVRPSLASLFGR